jgi:hypothetical protein
MNKKYYTAFLPGIFLVILQCLVLNLSAQSLLKDFEKMEGNRYMHPMIDKADSLSAREIVELRDWEGVPVWFSRDIFKNVCLTGECRMVRLRFYWDGAGNYLGIKVHENEPLTKTDHSVFSLADYLKLDQVLADSLSLLRRLVMKDLTIEREQESKYQADGITGATQPTIYELVVRNAVYTTYTLWHTVYGPTRQFIRSVLDDMASREYLQLLFTRQNNAYKVWAINYIRRHPQYHPNFYPEVIKCILSKDYGLFQNAIEYFTPANLSDAAVQKELALAAGDPSVLNKYEVLRKFSALPNISNEAILIFLGHYEKQQISAGLLGYVMELIRPENLENDLIVKKLKKLSRDKNLYVRNLATGKLSGIKN